MHCAMNYVAIVPHLPSSPNGRGHLAALSGSGSAPVHREGTSQLLVHFKCRDIDQLLKFLTAVVS